jgi:hypothetical protein
VNEFYWVSAPNVVPFVVTNRTGKRNRAGCVPVVRSLIAACRVAGYSPTAKTASMVALLVWRKGVRTFVAASRGQTSQSCLLGALAAAPGSVAMRRAPPAVFLSCEFCGWWRVALPLHFLLNAPAVVLSNLRLS